MPDPRHEPEILLNNILAEMRGATAQIDQRDGATRARLATLEGSVNDLLRKQGRPSGGNGSPETDARSQAIELLEQKHFKGASSDCLAYHPLRLGGAASAAGVPAFIVSIQIIDHRSVK